MTEKVWACDGICHIHIYIDWSIHHASARKLTNVSAVLSHTKTILQVSQSETDSTSNMLKRQMWTASLEPRYNKACLKEREKKRPSNGLSINGSLNLKSVHKKA